MTDPRRRFLRSCPALGVLVLVFAAQAVPSRARAQTEAQQLVNVPRGQSTVVTYASTLSRVLIGDPEIAEAIAVSANEIVLNGKKTGSTTLLLWGEDGSRVSYRVRVAADMQTLREELSRLLPDVTVQVTEVGSSLVLQGSVPDARVQERVVASVKALSGGADVVDYLQVPGPAQIMLRVRMAEVSRSVLKELSATLLRVDPRNVRGDDEGSVGADPPRGSFLGEGPDVTFSDAVNFYLFHDASNVAAFFQALRSEGDFRSLAEPNLLAYPGEQASFLAGGEFPYPTVQGANQGTSIQFKEFGIRLSFTPTVTNSGSVRIKVAPEVSQLDFARGLVISGFAVPSLLTRRAETVVELNEGQTFAIAGLLDNRAEDAVRKIPILGDIPILGALFRSRDFRDNQTELLVLVTPYLVRPSDTPPPLPTGEVEEWRRDRFMNPVAPPIPPQP